MQQYMSIMKICAACHKDLPKDSYSKKQWKLDQRRCKVCVNDNREVQPPQQSNYDRNTNEIISKLDTMHLEDVEKISDEELFKQPPAEDCPICFLLLPTFNKGCKYYSCCGTRICSGCVYAPVYDDQGSIVKRTCPFCRTPTPSSEEAVKRLKERMEARDSRAMHNLGCYYRDGKYGLPQDNNKALDLWRQAAELGYADAYLNLGYACENGHCIEIDKEKALYYYELAAIKGSERARCNLGNFEENRSNWIRALKHHMIAIRSGYSNSLNDIKRLYSSGHATKEDYTKALRLYQSYLSEIKSPQRDEAAAFSGELYRYY